MDSLEDAFRAMDSSGRGSLEEADLARALKRLDIEMAPAQLARLLEHLDANGDGVVDAGEFLDAMRRHEAEMAPSPEKASVFSGGSGGGSGGGSSSPIRQPRMAAWSRGGGGDLLSPSRKKGQGRARWRR